MVCGIIMPFDYYMMILQIDADVIKYVLPSKTIDYIIFTSKTSKIFPLRSPRTILVFHSVFRTHF